MALTTAGAIALSAGVGAAGSMYSGSQQAKGAARAGAESAAAARRGQDLSAQQFAQTRADLAPYRQVGTEALDLYKNMVLGGDMSSFQESPGYQYRLGQGVQSLERGAASRGSLLSGAQQKALTQFGQELGSDELARYKSELFNLAQQGLGAATKTGQFGMQSAQAQGQYGMLGAQAYGQGIAGGAAGRGQMVQGAAGAIGGGLGAYAGYQQNQQLIKALTG